MAGVIKAVGKQGIGSAASLCCILFVALPTSFLASFHFDLGLKGLWLGYGLSAMTLACFYSIVIYRLDWAAIAQQAAKDDEHSQCVEDSESTLASSQDSKMSHLLSKKSSKAAAADFNTL